MSSQDSMGKVAEAVREACWIAARKAYEDAGISGLCEEGRWECALNAIRTLDFEAIITHINES